MLSSNLPCSTEHAPAVRIGDWFPLRGGTRIVDKRLPGTTRERLGRAGDCRSMPPATALCDASAALDTRDSLRRVAQRGAAGEYLIPLKPCLRSLAWSPLSTRSFTFGWRPRRASRVNAADCSGHVPKAGRRGCGQGTVGQLGIGGCKPISLYAGASRNWGRPRPPLNVHPWLPLRPG
jgi:hypothetical protein